MLHCKPVLFFIAHGLQRNWCIVKRLGISVSLITIIIATAFSTADIVKAQAPYFYWESYTVELDVCDNGDILITETQSCIFQIDQSGGYRWIPIDKVEKVDSVEVFEGEKKLPATYSVEDERLWIIWDYPVHAGETYNFVLKYRVIGGLLIGDKADTVLWRAFFENRDAPIQNGRVIITLPSSLENQVLEIESYGVDADKRMIDSRTVEFTTREVLAPGMGLDVKITFPHGNITESPLIQFMKKWWFIGAVIVCGIIILLIIRNFIFRRYVR